MHPRRHRNSDSLGSTSRFSQPLNIPSPSPRSTGSQLKSAHSTAGPSSRPEGRPSHVRDSSLARCFPSTSSTSTRRLHPIHPPPTNSQTDHTATSTPLAFTSTARSAAPQPPTNTSSKSSSFFSPSNSSAKARGQCLPLDTSAPVRYLPGYRPLTTDEEIKLRRFMVDALIAKSKKYRSQISIPNLSTDAQSTLLTNLSLRKSAELRGDSLINFRMVRFVGRLLPHVPLPIRKIIAQAMYSNRAFHFLLYYAKYHKFADYCKGTADAFESAVGEWGEESTVGQVSIWIEESFSWPVNVMVDAATRFFAMDAAQTAAPAKRGREDDEKENVPVKKSRTN